jgi:spore coat protein CotH
MDQKKNTVTIHRSWWKRTIPLCIRHHSQLIFGSFFTLILMGFVLGSFRIDPIVFTQENQEQTSNSRFNIIGSVDLFDLNVSHQIDMAVSPGDYQIMMNDYQRQGLKTWVPANITIDGTLIENVGIRLKGNSTLRELSRNSRGWGRSGRMSNATFDNPSTLPFAVSFDEFEDDVAYQGREELAIRPARTGGTNINEALTLQLIADSGQVSQDYTWVNFRVNGYPSVTRLVIENPDKRYAEAIGLGSGVLYKSSSSNRFRYLGDAPLNYESDFDQINAKGTHDLTPIINLLKWLSDADAETFENELADWVDIDSFARYIATQDILENFDDMSGPGHNFLLWYDLVDEMFTVISWDMNLALGAGNFIGGFGGFGYGGGNALKERFMRSDFRTDISQAREELLSLWVDNNNALRTMDRLVDVIPLSDTLTEEQFLRDIAQTRRTVQFLR